MKKMRENEKEMKKDGKKGKKIKNKEKRFIDSLKKIIDPHTGIDIFSMGMIKNVKVSKDCKKIKLNFVPTSPFCPVVDYFVAAIKDAAKKAGFEDCTVEVVIS